MKACWRFQPPPPVVHNRWKGKKMNGNSRTCCCVASSGNNNAATPPAGSRSLAQPRRGPPTSQPPFVLLDKRPKLRFAPHTRRRARRPGLPPQCELQGRATEGRAGDLSLRIELTHPSLALPHPPSPSLPLASHRPLRSLRTAAVLKVNIIPLPVCTSSSLWGDEADDVG